LYNRRIEECVRQSFVSRLHIYRSNAFFVVVFADLNFASWPRPPIQIRVIVPFIVPHSCDHTCLSSRDYFSFAPSPPLDQIVFLLSVSASSRTCGDICEKKRSASRHGVIEKIIKKLYMNYEWITNYKSKINLCVSIIRFYFIQNAKNFFQFLRKSESLIQRKIT